MIEKRKYEKESLIEELDNLSLIFDEKVVGYLIGGLAMIHHGIKNATKDIDIVFDTESYAEIFQKNLIANGFGKVDILTEEYERMKTFSIFEKPGSFRFDLFVHNVCDGLILSEGMKRRAINIALPGNFILSVISLEDIFLFKSITNRSDDLADMSMIASASLNWVIIEDELRNQPNPWRWFAVFYQNLLELEEKHSIVSPLKAQFENEAEISIAMSLVISKLESNLLTYDEIIDIIDKDDIVFSKRVIDSLEDNKLIEDRNGYYHLIEPKCD